MVVLTPFRFQHGLQRNVNACFLSIVAFVCCVVSVQQLLSQQVKPATKTPTTKALLYNAAPAPISVPPIAPSGEDVLSFVNPLIGTGGHGHTYPGATVPFGMVQLSPDNGTEGWDWCSGYHYSDSTIVGFSHLHLSGTGIGDLLDISLMPTVKSINLVKPLKARKQADWTAKFSHNNETASPAYYRVKFTEPRTPKATTSASIIAELTANQWAGVHKYTFSGVTVATIVLDLTFAINWDKTSDALLQIQNDHLLTGYRYSKGWARKQWTHFAIEFSKPFFERVGTEDSTTLQPDFAALTGAQTKAMFRFKVASGEAITVKVALSSSSVEGALQGLKTVQTKSFEQVKQSSEALWRQELSKIQITTLNKDDKTNFYTALYHSFLAPVTHSDLNGEYKAPNNEVAVAKSFHRYDTFSLWDTFRAVHPLFTILQPARVPDMIQSLLAHYQELGMLPVWSFVGNETKTMTGYHAVPVIVDAYLKGFRGFNADTAYAAMKAAAMQDTLPVNLYREYGFVPHDKDGFSVTKTLEYAYDDWCIAQMAQALGKKSDYTEFMKRSQNYRHVFDRMIKFVRARMSDSSWKEPFNPKLTEAKTEFEFTEGNAWQYSWFAPHDMEGLMKVHGGLERFVRKLDSLFNESSDLGGGKFIPPDVSGLIGQYAHGNEPCHHIAYLYAAAGAPHKTQERVRQIIRTFYKARPDGLCGNDDCGQMSAWLIFSMLGFYPLNPAGGVYAIGTPLVKSAVLSVGKGKIFKISAPNLSEKNLYIKSAMLNGKPLAEPSLSHNALTAGGELVLEMSDTPQALWKN